ncbi:MAG TPA: 16S rRNA (guanine(966)-N(2))-methyltransferase RsmD [Elusimicrobia bacterium]|nr:16S rRNA (guanine(966)-N(2))-methyltransferase RsmD [Elusimicrobiota bacterium]
MISVATVGISYNIPVLRIIAGTARGRKLLSLPKDSGVKPISGRIKQSLFDILRPKVPSSRFLDLYAGTGAVGMEALSRGAEKVVFVELDKRCVEVIEKNLERSGWAVRGKVFRANALSALTWVPFRSGVQKFDLVFMGPPYRDREERPLFYCKQTLQNVASAGILEESGWIVAQHHFREEAPAPEGFVKFRETRYGDSWLNFFKRA